MHLVELRIARALIPRLSRSRIIRPVAVRTPVPLVRTGVGIEDDDAPVAVPVGNEQFVGRRVDSHVGGLTEIRRVVAAGAAPTTADLQEKLALAVELEDLVLTRSGCASPGDPDVVLMIDEDPVLVVGERPFVTVARTVPALEEST